MLMTMLFLCLLPLTVFGFAAPRPVEFAREIFETQVTLGMLGFANGQTYVNGILTVKFKSLLPRGQSKLLNVQLPLPLGMDLEENVTEGLITCTGVNEGGSAKGVIQAGDILRYA